jgi:hypothetical protein
MRDSKELSMAFEYMGHINRNNFYRYFDMMNNVHKSPYLFACAMLKHLNDMRYVALEYCRKNTINSFGEIATILNFTDLK